MVSSIPNSVITFFSTSNTISSLDMSSSLYQDSSLMLVLSSRRLPSNRSNKHPPPHKACGFTRGVLRFNDLSWWDDPKVSWITAPLKSFTHCWIVLLLLLLLLLLFQVEFMTSCGLYSKGHGVSPGYRRCSIEGWNATEIDEEPGDAW